MKTIINKLSLQVNIKNDIKLMDGYDGIDKLNNLKNKYKNITLSFNKILKNSPLIMKDTIETKDLENVLNGVVDKFKNDTINISVVAEVSSGKSTFLNALIFGKKVLDAKMGETTAKVFKISYGENVDTDTLKSEISKINSNTKEDISKEDFSIEDININDYIVNLSADNENLKKGIVLYDTPGFGTLNQKVMSKLIKEAVNRSDAVVLLLDISKGLKADEAKFIEEALSYIKDNKRFIVLNKFDASIDEDDDDEDEIQLQINKVVKDTKKELLKISNTNRAILDEQTYYLSAIKALNGKRKNNAEALKFSRFQIFEDSFWDRIVKAKKEIFRDTIENIIKDASTIIYESKKKIDTYQDSISNSNAILENIESIKDEINELVSTQMKIIEPISRDINSDATLVFNQTDIFKKRIFIVITESIQNNVNLISIDNIKEEDFRNAYKESIAEIDIKFKAEYQKFINILTTKINEKEDSVNSIIKILNKKMQDDKFKKLEFKLLDNVGNNLTGNKSTNITSENNKEIAIPNTGNISGGISAGVALAIFNNSSDIGDYAGNISAGAAAGAALATAIPIPVLSTVLGGAIGAGLGLLKSVFGGSDNKHEEAMERMQEAHARDMNKLAQENYNNQINQAKRDAIYEWTSTIKNEVDNSISDMRTVADSEYRTILTDITNTIYNAKSILKDMESIIEDPTQQKKIINENNIKIKELEKFIIDIENSFK